MRAGQAHRLDGLVVDLDCHTVRYQGSPLALSPLEFRALAAIARDPGRLHGFTDLRAAMWGHADAAATSTLQAVIRRLRRKLAEAGAQVRIESVRGMGYRVSTSPGVGR